MRLWNQLRSWSRANLGRSRMETEMDAELKFHMDTYANDLVRSGVPRDEAVRRARLEFGGIERAKEECRESTGVSFVESLGQDLRFGFRMLHKSPGFTIVAVLTLALGIAANTTIFSLLDAAILRPLPYAHAEQLVIVRETSYGVGQHSPSYPDFLDWRDQTHVFTQMAAVENRSFNLSGTAQPENIGGYAVSPNFLSVLGARPYVGRDFLPEEEKPGTAKVVLLSYQLWQSHFGGDPSAVGTTIVLNGASYEIIGVLPPSFHFTDKTDALTPIGIWTGTEDFRERGNRGDMVALARLAPGKTFAEARVEMENIASRLAQEYPKTNSDVGALLTPIRDEFLGDTRSAILVVFGAAIFVLLIACANVASLFLVRAATRTREIALRQTFGASRARVARQLLTEGFLLATIGGALGILFGYFGVSALGHVIPPGQFQNLDISINGVVLAFTAAIVGFVTIAFALVPAWRASGTGVQEALKEGGRTSTATSSQGSFRNALVSAEIGLALILLAGAGLMLQSLYRLLNVDPGFRAERVLTMTMNLRTAQYSKPAAVLNFWQQALQRVRAIPGVEAAAVGTAIPLTGDHDRTDITVEFMPDPGLGRYPHPDFHAISSGYLDALRIPLLSGRDFSDSDIETAPAVALINATMAHRFWPNEDAVGKRFHLGHPSEKAPWVTIVGVVADTKLYGLANPARLEIYLPYGQDASNGMDLVLRSSTDPGSLTSAVRAAVAEIDKDQPVFAVATMQQLVRDSVSTRRVTLILLGLFSVLALILASIGIYGVTSYSVAQRTHEIGIRMTLGAQLPTVMRMVLAQGSKVALIGIGIGLAGALLLTRLMSGLLYSVRAADPLTFVSVAALLFLVTLCACFIPARRAMRVDPVVALRHE